MARSVLSAVPVTTDAARDIRERSFTFGCEVARFALGLAPVPGVRCIVDQLLKAGTAVGAKHAKAFIGFASALQLSWARRAPSRATGGGGSTRADSHSHRNQHKATNVDRVGGVCILHSEFSITVLLEGCHQSASQVPVSNRSSVDRAISQAFAADAARARMPSVAIR